MSDVKRVIEILLQFKKNGQGAVTEAKADVASIAPAAAQASAAVGRIGTTAQTAMPQVAAAAKAAAASTKSSMADAANAGTKSFKDMLKGIKAEAGKGSVLGQSLKLAAGGGVVAGLGLAAHEFEELTSKIADLANKARAGQSSLRDLAAEGVRQIPIFGAIVRGFDNLREAVTGERSEVERADKMLKDSEATWKLFQKGMTENARKSLEWRDKLQQVNDELKILRTPEQFRAIVQAQIAAANSLQDAYRKYQMDAGLMGPDGEPGELFIKQIDLAKARAELESLKVIAKKAQDAYDAIRNSGGPGSEGKSIAQSQAGIAAENAAAAVDEQTRKIGDMRFLMVPLIERAREATKAFNELTAAEAAVGEEKVGDEWQKIVIDIANKLAKSRQEELQKTEKFLEERRTLQLRAADEENADKKRQLQETLRQLEEAHVATNKAADDDLARQKDLKDFADRKLLTQDELAIALATGLDKEIAQAQHAYDEEVIAWRKKLEEQLIAQDDFDRAIAQAAVNRDAAIQAARVQALPQATPGAKDPGFFGGMAQGLQEFYAQATNASAAGRQLAGDLAGGLTNAFTGIITGSKSAARAFSEFALSIIADLAKMVIEWEIAQLIMGFLKGFSLSPAASVGTVSGTVGEVPMPGGFPTTANKGGLIGAVRRFAGGGWVGGDFAGPNADTVPALLTRGEYVIQRPVVQQPGVLGLLEALNGGMAGMRRLNLGGMAAAPLAASGGGPGRSLAATPVHVIAADSNVARAILGGSNTNVLIDVIRQNRATIKGVLG